MTQNAHSGSPYPAGGRPASSYREGARAVASLALAVGSFGLAFGSLAVGAGVEPLAAVIMSATTFAGSAQFAAVSILDAGGSAGAAVAAAVLLNGRYAPIGVSVAPFIRGPWWKRLLVSQLVVDESWAIAHRGGGSYDIGRLIGAAFVLYPTWVLSTAVGASGMAAVADPRVLGLDAAFPALFLALLWPQLTDWKSRSAAALGAAIALITIPIAPPGVPILVAAAGCLLGLRR